MAAAEEPSGDDNPQTDAGTAKPPAKKPSGDAVDVKEPEGLNRPDGPDKPEQAEASKTQESAQGQGSNEAAAPEPPSPRDESPAQKLERRLKQQAAKQPSGKKEKSRRASRSSKATPSGEKPEAAVQTPANATTATAATAAATAAATVASTTAGAQEFDDFGLPIRKAEAIQYASEEPEEEEIVSPRARKWSFRRSASQTDVNQSRTSSRASSGSRQRLSLRGGSVDNTADAKVDSHNADTIEEEPRTPMPPQTEHPGSRSSMTDESRASTDDKASKRYTKDFAKEHEVSAAASTGNANVLSEFSHQKLATEKQAEASSEDGGWQTMPAFAPYDIYDDDNHLIAREHNEEEDEKYGYAGLGGAGKGYTRVLVDDDAESATSMDDNTQYLFKAGGGTSMMEDEEQQRDAVSQMQATKDLLTEGQRIAYVGITRLHMSDMIKEIEDIEATKKTRKALLISAESMKMWSQKMMIRLYAHMDISLAEQVMIEQLSEHGVKASDLTPALMANARVKNPMAGDKSTTGSLSSPRTSQSATTISSSARTGSPAPASPAPASPTSFASPGLPDEESAEPPPPYQEHDNGEELPAVRTPSQLPTTSKIDIDLRWTVLCDLFLVLIADSVYDSRSRVLLERVGQSVEIPAIDICKFERKVTEALEMQQNAEKENWDEKDHMETRRKMALKRRYVMMGLATVGGGLVIGLSAGLLAPVIGAGLAAGFTTIGVTGTSGFLAGAGGAAIITSSAAASGSVIGVRAANRRTGAVKTFEYRPLHNNKKVNLIVTVSGWMTGKVDDVRLPFSTVDPVMGDIYSVLWEPEMLTSMGDTINILATEALTQGLQQLLGSTILISLMAALQLPVVLSKLSYLIDNPWAVSLDRATMAGLILADSLIDRNLGTRPVTLVGYSLGSRVIFSCLQELARKGAYGLVQNVFLFGSPVVVKRDEYLRARSIVAGRFVNGYNSNDWILGYLFRLTNGGIRRVAGLGPLTDIPGMENMDVTEFVVGHMDYRTAMPRLLRECGWLVESDEFTEIEDPDPDNHAQRQRELINEIEEARKELENEGKAKKGGAFSFFGRKKKGEKQEWEIYEDAGQKKRIGKTEDEEGNNHGVLFDVDAIRAELAKEQDGKTDDLQLEQLQVRELESTLPPMKLDLTPTPSPGLSLSLPRPTTTRSPLRSPRESLAEPMYPEPAVPYRLSQGYRSSSVSLTEERTPTLPKRASFVRDEPVRRQHEMDDSEGISMTFDSSFDDDGLRAAEKPTSPLTPLTPLTPYPQPPPPPPKDTGYLSSAAAGSSTSFAASGSSAARGAGISPTVPAVTLSNPWGDEDDEDFGKEKEISMTFA